MIKLKEIYDSLPLPKKQSPHSYSAKTIKGYENHRIGKNYSDNPSLLIFVSEDKEDFLVPRQNLFNINIFHNLNCEIEQNDTTLESRFSVIEYTGFDSDLKELFLQTCEILVPFLGKHPTNKKIMYVVTKVIELFKSLSEPPKKSIQGLWAELFLIEQSEFPELLINYWHSTPEEKFDFNFGQLKLEVKSSGRSIRKHFFSSEQLTPSKDSKIIIASVLIERVVEGINIEEIIKKIVTKLEIHPKQKEKLFLLIYATIGSDISNIKEVKFDYQLAKKTLQFYNLDSIPRIEHTCIPNQVTQVKFISDLTNSTPLETTVDKLLKQYAD